VSMLQPLRTPKATESSEIATNMARVVRPTHAVA
jgi:hypothetical protein